MESYSQTGFHEITSPLPGYPAARSCVVKLASGGIFLILQPNYRLTPKRSFDLVDHSVILTEASLQEALVAAEFEIRELKVRFLPFTSKSKIPRWPWLVAAYLRFPLAQWVLGKQTFAAAAKIGSRPHDESSVAF
jgi:hypothetical protein